MRGNMVLPRVFHENMGCEQDGWKMDNFTYILKCADNSLYTGWTNDIQHRLKMHNSKKGAKYTRGRTPVELVYLEISDTKEEAMKREAMIKKLSRAEKEKLIASCNLQQNKEQSGKSI